MTSVETNSPRRLGKPHRGIKPPKQNRQPSSHQQRLPQIKPMSATARTRRASQSMIVYSRFLRDAKARLFRK
jgi:hypothetical protein